MITQLKQLLLNTLDFGCNRNGIVTSWELDVEKIKQGYKWKEFIILSRKGGNSHAYDVVWSDCNL